MWKFQGCVEIISRLFQENFEGVSGVFLRVFEAFSMEFPEGSQVFHKVSRLCQVIEVYENFEGV